MIIEILHLVDEVSDARLEAGMDDETDRKSTKQQERAVSLVLRVARKITEKSGDHRRLNHENYCHLSKNLGPLQSPLIRLSKQQLFQCFPIEVGLLTNFADLLLVSLHKRRVRLIRFFLLEVGKQVLFAALVLVLVEGEENERAIVLGQDEKLFLFWLLLPELLCRIEVENVSNRGASLLEVCALIPLSDCLLA